MKPGNLLATVAMVTASLVLSSYAQDDQPATNVLKVHSIFTNNMVIQRGKPIKVWGWAKPGDTVSATLGQEKAEAKVQDAEPVDVFGHEKDYTGNGRWEVTFPAREASAGPQTLLVSAGGETVTMTNIVVGDVWVMYGQSNMAFGLQMTSGSDLARLQANLPMLRHFRIKGNEQLTLQEDIRPEAVINDGWEVSTPETALGFSAIGYHFGATLQRSLGIPIGLIQSARGGASIESLVPRHKFDDDPIAKRYAESVEKRIAEFDPEKTADEIWGRQKGRDKAKGKPEPPRPDPKTLSSWSTPGESPSDMASVYNGMFGVFKGIGIKGVLFHQGYNNAISGNCRPKRYRVLTKLMIEGIREDFDDPDLAFGIIGLCAGGDTQNEDNFELASIDGGPYIREAQRLGLADVENQKNLMFLPAYDVKIPGLHPGKKQEHGIRAARWAIAKLYPEVKAEWREVQLKSAIPEGDIMVLTFTGGAVPDDADSIPRGFSIAGEDGKFYMAHARYQDGARWYNKNIIKVWSPLVEKPVAVRYAWARSPMGNLKVYAHPDRPFPSFRTDTWDFSESDDPAVSVIDRKKGNERKAEAEARLEERRTREAERGKQILEKIEVLKRPIEPKEE